MSRGLKLFEGFCLRVGTVSSHQDHGHRVINYFNFDKLAANISQI